MQDADRIEQLPDEARLLCLNELQALTGCAKGLTSQNETFFDADEDEVFASGQWGERGRMESENLFSGRSRTPEPQEEETTKSVTLSQLLDNVVILEESIKELTSVIHARRSLGIDALRYL